jgi:cytochrome bd-type quinol oxidase subunit 2
MKKLITIIILILNLALLVPTVTADDFDFTGTLGDFQDGVEEQSGDLQDGAEEIVLPDYQEGIGGDGAEGIVNTVKNFLDFFKLIVTPIAILFIVAMGIKLLTAGSDNEDAMSKAKNYIRYAVEGLVVIFVADAVVDVFFGAEGEILREGEAGAREFGRRTSELFQGVYGLLQVLIGAIAVLVIVVSGMRFVGGSYSDDQISSSKRHITWALVGLFVVGISEFVAKDILFQNQGTTLGIGNAEALFAQVTNFVAGTIGTLSFAFALYAGYLYVTARETEDQTAKAKKILVGALLGIILAAAAFAITNTLVDLDATR